MKIAVCIKQVPATNEVRMDPVTNTIIREGIESIINPFDSYAIEEAIRLKEKYQAQTYAISMGIPAVKELLREALAIGLDQAYLLSDRAFAGADTLATAHVLAAGIKKAGGADLIICGKMATDGDTAQVGPMLAEMLDYSQITDISAIESLDEQQIVCRKLSDDGYIRVRAKLPALITVVKEINIPRLPSINGLLRGQQIEIPTYSVTDLAVDEKAIGLSGSPTQVLKTFTPDLNRKCNWLSGNISEQVNCLLNSLEVFK